MKNLSIILVLFTVSMTVNAQLSNLSPDVIYEVKLKIGDYKKELDPFYLTYFSPVYFDDKNEVTDDPNPYHKRDGGFHLTDKYGDIKYPKIENNLIDNYQSNIIMDQVSTFIFTTNSFDESEQTITYNMTIIPFKPLHGIFKTVGVKTTYHKVNKTSNCEYFKGTLTSYKTL